MEKFTTKPEAAMVKDVWGEKRCTIRCSPGAYLQRKTSVRSHLEFSIPMFRCQTSTALANKKVYEIFPNRVVCTRR